MGNQHQPESRELILIVEDEFIVAHDLQLTLEKAGYPVVGTAGSVSQALAILERQKVDLVMLDIFLKGRQTGIDLAHRLLQQQIPFIYISANSNESVLEAAKATQPYGFIVKPYRDADVLMSIDIARYRYRYTSSFRTAGEAYFHHFFQELAAMGGTLPQLLLRMAGAFQPYIPFTLFKLSLILTGGTMPEELLVVRKGFDEYEAGVSLGRNASDALQVADEPSGKAVLLTGAPTIIDGHIVAEMLTKTIAPALAGKAVFTFCSSRVGTYKPEQGELLDYLAKALGADMVNLLTAAKKEMPRVTSAQPAANQPRSAFENLVGCSAALLKVMDQIRIVAPTDTSVLIMGASGTGKENVARNLHRLSQRHNRPLVIVNCAALPFDLAESILFGHEKGAFTGAADRRIGKFEEADGGTLFLDEIGEMSPELQSKLLRVLQDRVIERIGASAVTPVNIRVIAATSRNLEKEIEQGRFRLDLYYRLHVFPIEVPPLRERREDIPLLAQHFIQIYAQRFGKSIKGISDGLLNAWKAYNWPGNIRELEHLVERSVLLNETGLLEENLLTDMAFIPDIAEAKIENGTKTIAQNEREHIIAVLEQCNWRIGGLNGAAELLGVPPTTLSSKIKKFGIRRR